MRFNKRIVILAGTLLIATSCSMARSSETVDTGGKAPVPLQIWGEADPDEGDAPLATEMTCDVLSPGSEEPQFEWDFGDGSKGKGKAVKHTYTKVGKYDVIVRATDKNGRAGEDTLQVEVTKPEAE